MCVFCKTFHFSHLIFKFCCVRFDDDFSLFFTDSMFAAMYSNSPQAGNTSAFNIREISSPLRGMSISSPVTPLGALMYSPQLAQKVSLQSFYLNMLQLRTNLNKFVFCVRNTELKTKIYIDAVKGFLFIYENYRVCVKILIRAPAWTNWTSLCYT